MPTAEPGARYVDHGAYLWSLADEVFVRCVRCDAPGVTRTLLNDACRRASFECTSCGLSLTSGNGDWVGPVAYVGRRPCGHCGHQWLRAALREDGFPHAAHEEVQVTCPACSHECAVTLKVERRVPHDRAIDPHFGLPLLLLASTRHGQVWAYNVRHLKELQSYIAAKLRERRGVGNSTMFSRLPAWMKVAKHRSELLKVLSRLSALSDASPEGQIAGAPREKGAGK
jgi:hypothetical protein